MHLRSRFTNAKQGSMNYLCITCTHYVAMDSCGFVNNSVSQHTLLFTDTAADMIYDRMYERLCCAIFHIVF